MNNTITIITPSFNQGQFIKQTIDSVIFQKGDFYIDYIIADGGSTDGSIEIITKYDKLLKEKRCHIECKGINLRWWSKKDKGQPHAINQGICVAKGDILAWINSDDYYEQCVFEFIMRKFKENPDVDLIYGDCCEVYSGKAEKKIIKMNQMDFEEILRQGCMIYQPAVFFRKRAVDRTGLLDENLYYAMDYDLWLRILKEGICKYYSKVFANFRVWQGSKTFLATRDFKRESERVRRRYGGKFFDPARIHFIRLSIPFNEKIKSKFPRFYLFCKRFLLKTLFVK